MRKLIITQFLTLDGVVQAPGDPKEDLSGGFESGGWTFYYFDQMMGKFMGDFIARPFELLLGHATYKIFAAYWPHVSKDHPIGAPFNRVRKYVASRTPARLDWNNSVQLKGDVARAVRELKETDGPELQVHGSGNFVQTLIKNGLVDEFQLFIFPVTIGRGKRLFGEGTRTEAFKLLESKVSSTGVIIARYEPAGPLKTGSFAL